MENDHPFTGKTFAMKATEARLDNWVYDGEGVLQQVTESSFMYWGNRIMSVGEWRGVPLTEEWLTRFGITQDKHEDYYRLDDYVTLYLDDDEHFKYVIVIDTSFEGMPGVEFPCEFVHQLQNFWHTYKGEELELKDGEG